MDDDGEEEAREMGRAMVGRGNDDEDEDEDEVGEDLFGESMMA